MALQKQMIDVPLAQSIDTETDAKLTKGNLRLENGLVSNEGAVSKAPGREYYTKDTLSSVATSVKSLTKGIAVIPSKTDTLRIIADGKVADVSGAPAQTETQFWGFDEASNAWRPTGTATPCSVTIERGPRVIGARTDVLENADKRLYIAGPANGVAGAIYGALYDKKSQTFIKNYIALSGSLTDERVAAGIIDDGSGGERFVVVSPHDNNFWTYDPKSRSAIPAKATVAYNFSEVFDFCTTNNDATMTATTGRKKDLLLATQSEGTGSKIQIDLYTAHPTTGALTAFASKLTALTWAGRGTNQGQLQVCTFNDASNNLHGAVSFEHSGSTYTYVFTSAGSASFTAGPTKGSFYTSVALCGSSSLYGGIGVTKTPGFVLFTQASTATGVAYVNAEAFASTTGTTIGSHLFRNMTLAARPIEYNGRVLVPLSNIPYAATITQTYGLLCELSLLLDGTPAISPLARFANNALSIHGLAYIAAFTVGLLPPARVIDNKLYFGCDWQERFDTKGTPQNTPAAIYCSIATSTPSFASRSGGRTNEEMYVAGPGNVRFHDGVWAETLHGFPDPIGTPTDAGAGNVEEGLHYWCATYEYYDRNGNRHQSAPSLSASLSVVGASSITVAVPTISFGDANNLGWAAAYDQIRIVLWRTVLLDAYNFYRVTDSANSANAATVTITDNLADATIHSATTSNESLYSTVANGVVPNSAPPTAKLIAFDETRAYLVPTDDPSIVWYSKYMTSRNAVSWCELFKLQIPDGGEINGLKCMDGNKIVFKEDAIYAFTGDGPDDTGTPLFSGVRKLAETFGLSEPASLCACSAGLLYKGKSGFRLLERSLQSGDVGKEVRKYDSKKVLASGVSHTEERAYFVLDGGPVLVFDFGHRVWSTLNYETSIVHGSFVGSQFTGITADGTVVRDNPSRLNSDRLVVETSWLKLANIAGYQRIWEVLVLGDFPVNARLKVSASYDFKDEIKQEAILGAEMEEEHHIFRFVPAQQRCASMKLKLEDFPEDAHIIILNGLTLVAGVDSERGARVSSEAQG